MKKVLDHFRQTRSDYMNYFKADFDFESKITDLAHNIEKRIYQKHLSKA